MSIIEPYWWERAGCRDADPRDFEPKRLPGGRHRRSDATNKVQRDWKVARDICAACPVRESCFWEAVEKPNTLIGAHEEMFIAGCTPEEMRVHRQNYGRMQRATR